VEHLEGLGGSDHNEDHSRGQEASEDAPSGGPVALASHVGGGVNGGWELLPGRVGDAATDQRELGSRGLVGVPHVALEEEEQDAGHGDDQEGGTPELDVLSLGGLTFPGKEVEAP